MSESEVTGNLILPVKKVVVAAVTAGFTPQKPSPRIVLTATDNVSADFVFESPRTQEPPANIPADIHVERLIRKPSNRRFRRKTVVFRNRGNFKLEQFNWLKTVGKYQNQQILLLNLWW